MHISSSFQILSLKEIALPSVYKTVLAQIELGNTMPMKLANLSMFFILELASYRIIHISSTDTMLKECSIKHIWGQEYILTRIEGSDRRRFPLDAFSSHVILLYEQW